MLDKLNRSKPAAERQLLSPAAGFSPAERLAPSISLVSLRTAAPDLRTLPSGSPEALPGQLGQRERCSAAAAAHLVARPHQAPTAHLGTPETA